MWTQIEKGHNFFLKTLISLIFLLYLGANSISIQHIQNSKILVVPTDERTSAHSYVTSHWQVYNNYVV